MLRTFKFFSIYFLIFYLLSFNRIILEKLHIQQFSKIKLIHEIKRKYTLYKKVNINEVESLIPHGRPYNKNIDKKNEINIGFQLGPNYILRVMMTLASIMDSQKIESHLRFHFAIVLDFHISKMLKIYSLRDKIRDDVEFNFYNARRVEEELKDLNTKGPGAVAKLLLPQLLPDDVTKLIILDTGDLLVLRDLSIMYNFDMDNYTFLGIPGGQIGKNANITKKKFEKYINSGSMLVDVIKVKNEDLYSKYVKYKDIYKNSHIGDQHLLNDISFGKIGYLPMKFGICSPYKNDKDSDKPLYSYPFEFYIDAYLKSNYEYCSNITKYLKIRIIFYFLYYYIKRVFIFI